MDYRNLRDLKVSAVGFGCMGFSHGYGALPERKESIDLIRYAYDLGCNFLDTAEGYGNGHNEELVGSALKPMRNKVIIATKFKLSDEETDVYNCIKKHLQASLSRLQTDYVDLYYWHRINRNISLREVAKALGKLINEGLIRGWGLSQANADDISTAQSETPLSAVQNEFSMMERMYEKEVIPLCEELNIGFVPFSPLGSGFLSGKYRPDDKYQGDDVRRVITRFTPANMLSNQPLIDLLEKYANKKKASKAQIAIAWMLMKYPHLVPIPSMRTQERIVENLGAADIVFRKEEIEKLDQDLERIKIYGNRTDEDIATLYK